VTRLPAEYALTPTIIDNVAVFSTWSNANWADQLGLAPTDADQRGSARHDLAAAPWRRGIWLRRAAFVVLVAASIAAWEFVDDVVARDNTALGVFITLVVAAAVTIRHHSLLLVLLTAGAGHVAVIATTGSPVGLKALMAVPMFSFVRFGPRASRVAVGVGVAVVAAMLGALAQSDPFLLEWLSDAALLSLPIALADAARSRSDRLTAVVESESERRVQHERLRIARDLHDVVGHSLSVIAVQSGVAAHVLERDPQVAKRALEAIALSSRSALDELRTILGVLRSNDTVALAPLPTDPNDWSDISRDADALGVQLRWLVEGWFPPGAAESSVVAVHRIIHEAVRNVGRHAGRVAADISVRHGIDDVVLKVVNGPSDHHSAPLTSTGVGIIGMRERAVSMGGSLDAGPNEGGGFEVRAVIPYVHHRSGAV
jgi:signal transduction histidine kinase